MARIYAKLQIGFNSKVNSNKQNMTFSLHKIADISIQMEAVVKNKQISHAVLHRVKSESTKYRPSKSALQKELWKQLEEELPSAKKRTSFLAISGNLICFEFDTVLFPEQIAASISKLNTEDIQSSVVVAFNRYRSVCVLYSANDIKETNDIEALFDEIFGNLLKHDSSAKLFAKSKHFWALKFKPTVLMSNFLQ